MIKTLLAACSVFLLVACGQGTATNSNGDETEWELGEGELSDQIGEEELVLQINEDIFSLIHDQDELATLTGFSQPTGEWFLVNGEGQFGYGITNGQQAPHSPYSVRLFANNETITVDRDVRIKLTRLNQELEQGEVVLEETVDIGEVSDELAVYEGELPADENVIYLLSAEILSDSGEVEDSLIGLIVVAAEELNASLSLDQQGETANLILENFGPTSLTLGMHYAIEQKIDDQWYVVPLDLAFIEIAIMLAPGQSHEQDVDLSELEPGNYRVIKNIQAEGYPDLSTRLAVEFTIE
ncbi:hypothetical protein SAMN04488134_101712 [Amphibacillus marinus]|uniref:Bacterial Ig-like domain-containing protein n=1 Tax=Amphibacillus marinus TaxID=872970 RepID=A0A1H8ISP4_9BACI|nr:immunoglobulin-like domain-containing protein [Amphibacillus marinus]SEN71452.1 hypothetical protein SAMN04488134_101712 [Amphibacillus marinus]